MKPVFIQLDDGTCIYSRFAIDNNGQIWGGLPEVLQRKYDNGAVENLPQRIPCKNAEMWGVISMSKAELEKVAAAVNAPIDLSILQPTENPTTNMNNKVQNNNQAFLVSQKVSGQEFLTRAESPQGGDGTGMSWTMSMRNAIGGGTVANVLWGDGAGVLATEYAIPALPAPPAVVIGGTKGTQTLAYINNKVRYGQNYRFKGEITMQASTNAGATGNIIYSAGDLMQLLTEIEPDGSTYKKKSFDFLSGYRGDNFDTSIRYYPMFDFCLSNITAIWFKIPDGYTLSFTGTIYSVTDAVIMGLAKS